MKNKRWKGLLALAAGAVLLAAGLLRGTGDRPSPLTYGEFWALAEEGGVATVILGEGEEWQAVLADGSRARTPNPRAADGKERLLALGIDVREKQEIGPALLLGVMALGLGAALFLSGGRRGAPGFKKYAAVQAAEDVPGVTFADVIVPRETLQSMQDLVDFLREPERYARYGARFPKGVMLYGPPGTGKTLLARALAGEAKAPFFAMSGADFVQVYVGVGASRVRELFRKARKAGRGVIFIDEIDAIGKKRDNGNDEREQTLNALLTEMSGFSGGDGIIVLAATNRLDTLDAALLREGRFDRRIEIGLPDYEERLGILAVHARKKPLAAGVSLSDLARKTVLFSGAQLETLLNEAAIRAARRGNGDIDQADVDQAFFSVAVGEERPGRLTDGEKLAVAYHEAGHALVTRLLMPGVRLTRVTIIPSSRGAAGYSMSVSPDRTLYTRRQLEAMICAALAGRAAEELALGREDVTNGAASDLKKAREIAAAMANDWAMGEGMDGQRDERAIFGNAMEKTRALLRLHRSHLERLARELLQKETLEETALSALLASSEGMDAGPSDPAVSKAEQN